MAFLTGIGLETRLGENEALAIPKKRPPRRRRQQLELEDGGCQAIAICDQEKPVQFGQLLKQTEMLADTGDPLEELRRRIKRTRGKMDAQNQVMNGFLSDVRQMHAIDRSFSSAELSRPSTPTAPALTAGSEPSLKRLTAGPPRPSSASNSSGGARAILLRSDPVGSGRRLGESRSQPALMAAAVGSLHQAAPLTMPQRRAPPGAPCSDLQRQISGAAAARQRAVASSAGAASARAGGGMSRLSQHSRSSPLVA